jgi:hypothetical protein
MSEGYLIGPDFLGRIRRVVDGAESAIVRMEPTRVQTRFEGDIAPPSPKRSVIQAGFFSGAWPKNGYKTVTLAEDPSRTVIVYNPVVSIPDRGQRRVFFVSVSVGTGLTTFSTLNFLNCEC